MAKLSQLDVEILLTKERLRVIEEHAEVLQRSKEIADVGRQSNSAEAEAEAEAGTLHKLLILFAKRSTTVPSFIADNDVEMGEEKSVETAKRNKGKETAGKTPTAEWNGESDHVEATEIENEEDVEAEARLLADELKKLKVCMAELRDALRTIARHLRNIRLTRGFTGGDAQYEVAAVVDSKLDNRCRRCPIRYRVRWAGYEGTDEEYSWVSPFELGCATEAVAAFHAANPDKPQFRIVNASALGLSW